MPDKDVPETSRPVFRDLIPVRRAPRTRTETRENVGKVLWRVDEWRFQAMLDRRAGASVEASAARIFRQNNPPPGPGWKEDGITVRLLRTAKDVVMPEVTIQAEVEARYSITRTIEYPLRTLSRRGWRPAGVLRR